MPLDTKPRQTLNDYFVKNAIPTESQFKELIDAQLNQADDGVFRDGMAAPLSVIAASGPRKHVLQFYGQYPAQEPEWLINLAPTDNASGLSVSDAAGNSRLYIDRATGKVGLGTVTPDQKLTVQGGNLRIQGGRYRRLEVVSDEYWAGIELVAREVGKDTDPNNAGHPHIDFTHGDLDSPNYGVRIYAADNKSLKIHANLEDLNLGVRGTMSATAGIGVGTDSPAGALDVRVDGVGSWNRFVVNTTNSWGDGNNQYVTIGAGGANGIMLNNPHVPWSDGRASIRYGRSGGVSTGHFWDVGVRDSNAFSLQQSPGGHRLWIDGAGNVGINTTSPAERLTVQDGDVRIQGGRYRRLKIISDTYWAGIELVARQAGEAGHPHIDFTHGELDSPNFGLRVAGATNQRLDVSAQDGQAELRVYGEVVARSLKATVYQAGDNSSVNISSVNSWQDFPSLSLQANLPVSATVLISYNIAMGGGTDHLVSRLMIDNVEQCRTITGNTAYWGTSNMWMTTLAAGAHTVKVQYRTPAGGNNNPGGTDWHDRTLTMVVLGANI